MNAECSRLWLAIRLSDISLTALNLDETVNKAIVVIEKKRVIFANVLAEESGAEVGMDITTAQLLSGCTVVERNEEKEQDALHRLSEKLYQFSPYVDRYCSPKVAESGLLLEISSCLALFNGLKKIVELISDFLINTCHRFDYGLGHTAKAAWYLSFAHHDIVGDETKSIIVERLNKLPIDLMFDYPKEVNTLIKTGFKSFGDLAKQIEGNSTSSFRKRLGHKFTDEICETYDIDQNFLQNSLFQKPRDIYQPDEWFEEEIQFEYPVTIVEQLKPAIEILLQKLSDYLRKRQRQCQYIQWRISDIYRANEFIKVNSDMPQTHWELLYDLTLIQFDNRELPFEVDVIKLICSHTMPLQSANQVLDFDQSKRKKKSVQDFAVTIAKLKARLGDSAVYKIGYRSSRVPELSNVIVALSEKCNQDLSKVHLKALRPKWILTKPEIIENRGNRLYWHGYLFTIVGPERIIGEWWQEPIARDYFLAKRHDNIPVWIFFDLYTKQWYVHGVFA